MDNRDTGLLAKKITRRTFLGASLAVAASAAALSTFGCTPQSNVSPSTTTPQHTLPTNTEASGTWVSAACWHNCGGRCMNKVMVQDGVVIRQKTDDTHDDSPDFPQQRGCVRGKAQQQQCFGADRIMHPLKRKGWAPGGGSSSNGAMRGKDDWEVITWDEAISTACSEIKRILAAYGNTSFYTARSNIDFMNVMGGSIASWETTSMGTYSFNSEMIGLPNSDLGNANDRFDMENADLIVMHCSNPVWSAAGTPINNWINARDKGCKFISIDPIYNPSAQMLDAQWIPIRTGTDIAFFLAVAYEMMRLDAAGGNIIDWDFLDKYTVGFDADHMPPDATINENFKDYVMGTYDSTPKTPAWANPICGVPTDTITSFAQAIGKSSNVMLLHNFAASRNHGADMLPQIFMAIGAMGGHIGKSGNATGSCYHADAGNAGPRLVQGGSAKMPSTTNGVNYHPRTSDILQIIVDGGGTFNDVGGTGASVHPPQAVTVGPIKCIIHKGDAAMQTSQNQTTNIKAHRTVEFVLTCAQFMTSNAVYSDIILPVTTEWETPGGVTGSNREFVVCYSKVTDPIGEAKTDQDIGTLILQGMGYDPTLAYATSKTQQFFEQIAGSTVIGSDGKMAPLVTITADDISKMGVNGSPQQGIVTMTNFINNGGYQFQRSKGDKYGSIGYSAFIQDPVANPLTSNSGKFEIYCQARYKVLQDCKFPNYDAYKPYPTYVEPPAHVGYVNTFKDRTIGGTKGDYPFLMYNMHYIRRSHSVFNNCPWLRETWTNPVFISRTDAAALGISTGDTVLVSSYMGQTLRMAGVLDILMPGVVSLVHGSWVQVDETTGIDQAGSDNYLIGPEYSGFGVTGYNDGNCNIQKYTGTPLKPDAQWPARIVGA